MKKIINFFKQGSSANKQTIQDDCITFDNLNKKSTKNNNPINSTINETTLYVYFRESNSFQKIKHNHKIVKITSMGLYICFTNDRNEIFKINSNNGTYQQLISTVKEINPPINIPIKYLLAGYFHLTIILENNLMYGHGSTDNYQIGPNNYRQIETLKLINTNEIFKNYNKQLFIEITHACCGSFSTIIVLNNKEIWYCGLIGNGIQQNFTKIDFNGMVVKKITCGYGHLLILNNKGELFGYGRNEYKQLFITSTANYLTKIELPFLQGNAKILDAFSIRLSHISVIVTDTKEIYVFGYFGSNLGSSFTKLNNYDGKIRVNQSKFHLKTKVINEVTSYNINDPIIDEDGGKKYNYLNGELSIYGGFASLFFVDNLKRNIWLGGMRGKHFTNESIYLKESDNNFLSDVKDQILDVACGDNVYGVLVGKSNLVNCYMLNNLKRLVKIICGDIVKKRDIVPLSDVEIRCMDLLYCQ